MIALLVCCMAIDSADEISNLNESSLPKDLPNDCIIVDNNDSIANSSLSMIKVKSSDLVHIKPHYPIVTITAKPSCGCRHSYTWHKRSFIDYCPHCHHYNCLVNKHKWQSRYEQELTCKFCDSDFCGVCGKNKYSWSKVYLRRA